MALIEQTFGVMTIKRPNGLWRSYKNLSHEPNDNVNRDYIERLPLYLIFFSFSEFSSKTDAN